MAWLGAQHTKALKTVAATVNGDISSAVKTRRPVGQLSVYDTAPEGHVTIEDFESFALARLRGEASDSQPMWHILLTTVRDIQRHRSFIHGPRLLQPKDGLRSLKCFSQSHNPLWVDAK